jgi:hypothetical protein
LNLGRRTLFDDQFGEGAVAAADVDPSKAGARRYPIKEELACEPAPGSRHPLVGGPVVEADLILGHQTLLVQIMAHENIAFYSGGKLVDVIITTGSYRPTEPYPSPEP